MILITFFHVFLLNICPRNYFIEVLLLQRKSNSYEQNKKLTHFIEVRLHKFYIYTPAYNISFLVLFQAGF